MTEEIKKVVDEFNYLSNEKQSYLAKTLEDMYDRGYRDGFKVAGKQTVDKLRKMADNVENILNGGDFD